MARWQLAARLDNANRILGSIAESPQAGHASATALAADAKAGEALAALQAWDLAHASSAALEAYRLVLLAAAQANVKVEPWSCVAEPGAWPRRSRGGDRPAHPRPARSVRRGEPVRAWARAV